MNMTLASALFRKDLNYKMYCTYGANGFSNPKIFERGAYNSTGKNGVIVNGILSYRSLRMDGNIATDSDTEVLTWTYNFATMLGQLQ